jgi:hypothetical protein
MSCFPSIAHHDWPLFRFVGLGLEELAIRLDENLFREDPAVEKSLNMLKEVEEVELYGLSGLVGLAIRLEVRSLRLSPSAIVSTPVLKLVRLLQNLLGTKLNVAEEGFDQLLKWCGNHN